MRPRHIGTAIIIVGIVVMALGAPDRASPAGAGWDRENLGAGGIAAAIGAAVYVAIAAWENRRAKAPPP